jgi:hypothetical protein
MLTASDLDTDRLQDALNKANHEAEWERKKNERARK